MIDTYKEVRECDYKGEHYSVRDNGAIMRHPRPGKKPRPKDGVWTFGEKNEKNGYMYFTGTVRVHAVAARWFSGPGGPMAVGSMAANRSPPVVALCAYSVKDYCSGNKMS